MDKENNRGNLSEMERIHRGLEAFLEKEVYEEHGARGDAGPEGYKESEESNGYAGPEGYGESEESNGYGGQEGYGEFEKSNGYARSGGQGGYHEQGKRQEYGAYGGCGDSEVYDAGDERRPCQGQGVYDIYDDKDGSDACDEYGQYGDCVRNSEYNEYEEYEAEESAEAAMMRQHADHSGAKQRPGGSREKSARRREGGREKSAQRPAGEKRGTSRRDNGGREKSAQRQGGGKRQSSQREESGKRQPSQREESRKRQSPQREESGKRQSSQREESGKRQSRQRQGGGKGQSPQSREGGRNPASPPQGSGGQPARKKRHRGLRRFLTAALVLLLAVTALWYVTISHLYDKVEYTPTEILTDQPMKEEGVTNILLIGNDSRAGGGDGRSDAMILVSISNRTKTIHLTSLLRDIYVEIPGHESNRLNAAYAFGGPELLLETIKENLDIEVNRYVQVNFQAFANLIDAVGGVELELTNEEVQLVNAYLNEYNLLENRPIETDYLPTDASGLLHLNGPQALAYSRNRYIGSDFGRTERQRKILEAVFHQLPASMLTNLDDLIDGILPNLTTNISRSECYTLSLDAAKLLTYELVQASIPIAGSYQSATIRKMAVLQVDFEKNREFIRTQIYGED